MTAGKRKVVTRLLVLGANLATIAVIIKVATYSPVRAVVLAVACLLVALFLQRREVANTIHRIAGR